MMLELANLTAAYGQAVALENAVVFAGVLGLATAGVVRRSNAISGYAYVAMFMALGWCAFPLLGRVSP